METRGSNKEPHFKTDDLAPQTSVEVFIMFVTNLEKQVQHKTSKAAFLIKSQANLNTRMFVQWLFKWYLTEGKYQNRNGAAMSSSLWLSTQERFPGLTYPCRWPNVVLWPPRPGKCWTATRKILNRKEKTSLMKNTRVQFHLCEVSFASPLEKDNEPEKVQKSKQLIMQYKNTRPRSKDEVSS